MKEKPLEERLSGLLANTYHLTYDRVLDVMKYKNECRQSQYNTTKDFYMAIAGEISTFKKTDTTYLKHETNYHKVKQWRNMKLKIVEKE